MARNAYSVSLYQFAKDWLRWGFIMKNIVKRFLSNESGATAIEYGLIAAMMAVALIALFTTLRGNLNVAFNNIGSTLTKK